MSSIPPVSEVCDALLFAVIPAFGVTSLVAVLIPTILGRRAEFVAAAIAFVVGVAAANFFRGCFVLRFESDSPLSPFDLMRGLWSVITGQSLVFGGTDSDPILAPRAGRYWIPWAGLIAIGGGLLLRLPRLPTAMSSVVRICIAAIAARMIVPADLASGSPWLAWPVGLLIFSIWSLAERRSVRVPHEVTSAAAGLASLGAAAVLLHAHSARLTDVATLIAFASFGISVVACWKRIDAAGAVPAIAVGLPGVLVSGYHETFSEVPALAFVLPALAPLATALLAIFPDRCLCGWRRWFFTALLVGLPTLAAVVLASRAETLDFGHSGEQF